MRVFIDADACPVTDIAICEARRRGVEVFLLCDTAHELFRSGATTITVDKGADSADFRLVNLLAPGDIAVTQDYGLAAMCLSRRAVPLNQNGLLFTDKNIDSLLLSRHVAKKVRQAGGRLKGPKKRTAEQDEAFRRAFIRLLQNEK